MTSQGSRHAKQLFTIAEHSFDDRTTGMRFEFTRDARGSPKLNIYASDRSRRIELRFACKGFVQANASVVPFGEEVAGAPVLANAELEYLRQGSRPLNGEGD
jgi:hypothetical protein